jgi:acetyl-CoA carboxylase beta subunit
MLDAVVDRREMRTTIQRMLDFMMNSAVAGTTIGDAARA